MFHNIFNNPLWSDINVVLAVENGEAKTFHAHRAVLASASPFLYDLLYSCQEDNNIVLKCQSEAEAKIAEDCLLIVYNQGIRLDVCIGNDHLTFAIKYRLENVLYFILSNCTDRAVFPDINLRLIDEACYCLFGHGLCSTSKKGLALCQPYLEYVEELLISFIPDEQLEIFGNILNKSNEWLDLIVKKQIQKSKYRFPDAILLSILRLSQMGYLSFQQDELVSLFSLKKLTSVAARSLIAHPVVQEDHKLCRKFLNEVITMPSLTKSEEDVTVTHIMQISKMELQTFFNDGIGISIINSHFETPLPFGWLKGLYVEYGVEEVTVRFNDSIPEKPDDNTPYDLKEKTMQQKLKSTNESFGMLVSASMRITYGKDEEFVEEECTHFMRVNPGEKYGLDVLSYGALYNHLEDDDDIIPIKKDDANDFYIFKLDLTFHV